MSIAQVHSFGHEWDHVGSVHALNPRVGVVAILQTYFVILMFFTCMIMMVLVCNLGISYGSPLILSHLYTQSSANLKVWKVTKVIIYY